jgi:hypothetical protein
MEPERALQLILYIVIILAIAILVFQVARILGNVNSILKDFKKVSNGVSMLLSSPEGIKQSISDFALLTVDKVVDRQVYRIKQSISNNLLPSVINLIAGKK